MDLVFLDTIVAEDLSDQRAPHQLRVSVFDLGAEEEEEEEEDHHADEIRCEAPLRATLGVLTGISSTAL